MYYFTTHGTGPGTLPKGVTVVEVIEGKNSKGTMGDWIKPSRLLTEEEMKYYDYRECRIELIKIA